MGYVKAWQDEIWEIRESLGEGHPFSQDEIESMAQERLQAGTDEVQESDKFPRLKKFNAYLNSRLVIPE